MALSLTNFSIETDSIVQLWFCDGTSKRVSTSELKKHLEQPDVRRIEDALKLRHSYFKRVLPPWMVLGLGLAISIGVYDVVRITSLADRPEVASVAAGTVTSWDTQALDAVSMGQLGIAPVEPEPVASEAPASVEAPVAPTAEATPQPEPAATPSPAPAPAVAPAPAKPAPQPASPVAQAVGSAVKQVVDQAKGTATQIHAGLTELMLRAQNLLAPRK